MALNLLNKTLISTIIILLCLVACGVYFLAIIPMRIAQDHEEAYFRELYGPTGYYSLPGGTTNEQNEITTPHNMTLQPLIYNAFQLSSPGWERELSLNIDGTAKYPMQRRWVYVGGTPAMPRSWREKISLASPPGKGSCVDPPSICSDFNEAFSTVAERSHGPNPADFIGTSLNFFECDNSPLLCDLFRVAPVMLLHLETKPPCLAKKDYSFVCSTKWTFVGLPLKKMPFSRTVSINGLVVPAFPSAFEQLRSLTVWEGSLASLQPGEFHIRQKLAGNEGDGFTFEGVDKEADPELYESHLREVVEFLRFVQSQV